MPNSYHDYARVTGAADDPPEASSNLLGYWPIQENSGTTVYDDYGSVDGSFVGGPSWTSDAKTDSVALDFDGTDDGVDFGTDPYTNSDISNGSVTFWVKARSSGDGNQGEIFTLEDAVEFAEDRSTSGDLAFDIFDNNNNPTIETGIANDTWKHYAGTWDGSTMILYKDGSQVNSTSAGSPDVDALNRPLSFGYRGSSNKFYLDGILDDVRLYDKTLSSTEVNNIYNNTK